MPHKIGAGDPKAIAETRDSMDKRLGEIITAIIGDDRIEELFKKDGHPKEYEGKPTGLIALDLGVITPETKTALLVAQAAERTARLAEDMVSGAFKTPKIPFDDGVFKFVGSERDPTVLRHAQGIWEAAQMFRNEMEFGGPVAIEYAHGFKSAASDLYREAAVLASEEGHIDAAVKFEAVSESLRTEPLPDRTPAEALDHLLRAGGSEAYKETLNKLKGLAELIAATPSGASRRTWGAAPGPKG